MDVQQEVLAWLKSDPEFFAWARKTVEGDEFVYGDDELHEALYDMLYTNYGLSNYGFGSPEVVRARNNLRQTITKEQFDRMNWIEFRELLLAQ